MMVAGQFPIRNYFRVARQNEATRLDFITTISLQFGHEAHCCSGVIAHRAARFW